MDTILMYQITVPNHTFSRFSHSPSPLTSWERTSWETANWITGCEFMIRKNVESMVVILKKVDNAITSGTGWWPVPDTGSHPNAYTQFSTLRSGTRLNSPTLLVTSTAPMLLA